MKKALLAMMLCAGLIGCRKQTEEEPEKEPTVETETAEETEDTENPETVSEVTELIDSLTETPPALIVEVPETQQPMVVEENAVYEVEEDSDYIIN